MYKNIELFAITAADKNYGIGYENNILFFNKKDMQMFREFTLRIGVCLMGRKTYESLLPNLLKGRVCIVLSSQDKPNDDSSIWIKDILELNYLGYSKIAVIGGAEIYDLTAPFIDEWYLTKFRFNAEKVDIWLKDTTVASIKSKTSCIELYSDESIEVFKLS